MMLILRLEMLLQSIIALVLDTISEPAVLDKIQNI